MVSWRDPRTGGSGPAPYRTESRCRLKPQALKILFDQGTPAPLRHTLTAHTISTAYEMGWAQFENGDLLNQAEASFDVLITTDQNLRYQQNLSGRRLAILVLPTT